ncbi:MAG: Trm112 family protein [Candidatus Puniceispirillales bacterium]
MSNTENESRILDPVLLDILVCPVCQGPLTYDKVNHELISEQAGLAFPVRDGIPILLVDEARKLDLDK